MTYIKLTEPPRFVFQDPTCSACGVDLVSEDGWLCPVCGTSWSYDASDDDPGNLYEEWSGEELDAEPVDEDAAYQAGITHAREQRTRIFLGLGWCEHGMPGACLDAWCPGGTKDMVSDH